MDVIWRLAWQTAPPDLGCDAPADFTSNGQIRTDKVLPISFLADGNKLITGSWKDGLIHEWDSATGRELRSWRMPGVWDGALAFSPDERSCAVASAMRVMHHAQKPHRRKPDDLNLDILEGSGTSYSPTGKLFAVGQRSGFCASVEHGELADGGNPPAAFSSAPFGDFFAGRPAAGHRQRRQGSGEIVGHGKLAERVHVWKRQASISKAWPSPRMAIPSAH